MAQESIEQLQPGFTFKGALHDFATALQGSPSCTLPSSYSPAAPLNPSGFDLHLAFAAHRLRFLASNQFLSSVHLCADDEDDTLSFFDVSMTYSNYEQEQESTICQNWTFMATRIIGRKMAALHKR